MRNVRLLGLLACLALAASAPTEPPHRYLASITGIELRANEFVDRFNVDTFDVEIVAVCHIPPGWTIRAGGSAAPDGIIEGDASHGVTFLDARQLGELGDFVLISIRGPVREEQVDSIPASFAGRARIGRYGTEESRRETVLSAENIALRPAVRCPDPRR